jgi:hypothetical protein
MSEQCLPVAFCVAVFQDFGDLSVDASQDWRVFADQIFVDFKCMVLLLQNRFVLP